MLEHELDGRDALLVPGGITYPVWAGALWHPHAQQLSLPSSPCPEPPFCIMTRWAGHDQQQAH